MSNHAASSRQPARENRPTISGTRGLRGLPDCRPGSSQPPTEINAGAPEAELAPERVLASPWHEPAARRAIGFVASRRIGGRLSTIRVNLPIEAPVRSLWWLCFGPQAEIDNWRTQDPYAGQVLQAVSGWLGGQFMTFRGALAASLPLEVVLQTITQYLDSRALEALRRRAAGDTLEVIGSSWRVSKERIRQLEAQAIERVASHCKALRAVAHPAFLALDGHLTRLAASVLAAACHEDDVLLPEAKRRWIKRVLPPVEAEALAVMLWVSEDADPELKPVLDPLSVVGRPFQGGRTTRPWCDSQVVAIKQAFDGLCAGSAKRCARPKAIAARAGLAEDWLPSSRNSPRSRSKPAGPSSAVPAPATA